MTLRNPQGAQSPIWNYEPIHQNSPLITSHGQLKGTNFVAPSSKGRGKGRWAIRDRRQAPSGPKKGAPGVSERARNTSRLLGPPPEAIPRLPRLLEGSIRTGTCWPYRAGGQRLCPTKGLNAPLATDLTTSRRESPTDLLCLDSPAFQGTDLRVGQQHLSDPTTHGEDTPVFGQTNQDHPHSKSPTTAREVGLLLSSRQRLKTERVSVDSGLFRTSSHGFQVLGCDLPQHLPQHQFSSVNSTEDAKRLR